MKATLRRALDVCAEIISFNFSESSGWASPLSDQQTLASFALRLRALSGAFSDPGLKEKIDRLPIDTDGVIQTSLVTLRAELLGIAAWIEETIEESESLSSASDIGGNSSATNAGDANVALLSQIDELQTKNQRLSKLLEEPDPKRRKSYLIAIIAMACGKYDHRPGQPRNTSTSQIASDIEQLGLHLDDETILSMLRQAFELLEGEIQIRRAL